MSSADPDELPLENESDDDDLWDEVVVPEEPTLVQAPTEYDQLDDLEPQAGPSTRPNIEITLKKAQSKIGKGKSATEAKKIIGISPAERRFRIDVHKMHTVTLLLNVRARNRWLNDELLQARLLSLTPLWVQDQLSSIHKSRIPDPYKRGTMFELAVTRLAEWWAHTFFEVLESGHLRSRTFDEVQQLLIKRGFMDSSLLHPVEPDSEEEAERETAKAKWNGKGPPKPKSAKGRGKQKAPAPPPDVDWLDFIDDNEDVEVIRTEKSLMKHALQHSGTRDVSAQLFTALCRSLGIPARLVCSLQSVPWQASVGRPKASAKPKGKGKAAARPEVENDDDVMEVDVGSFPGDGARLDGAKGKGKAKAPAPPAVKLRKSKSKGQRLGSARPPEPPDPLRTPPIFWTEVFSKPDGRWLPVDPIRALVNKPRLFDPSAPLNSLNTSSARNTRVDNRMQYVIAFEEDGYARDLTVRYAREYGAKIAKSQAGGRGQQQWWEGVLSFVTRPYRLNRDDMEDEELTASRYKEPMPSTMTGFKDHALYVLERHLHQDEIIAPHTSELGKFRGESVYARSSVLQLKTAENWMRRGRQVRPGEQALKQVKQRASTINRKRELEVLREAGANGDAEPMQGLYAERQTEVYRPIPVIDGVIPKNDFGNIDLYVPTMLPQGAAHIPYRGTAKIARQLGFDFAEAVTGFEFRKGRANPIISGVVVAAENEAAVLEAYWETEQAAAEKEAEKRRVAVIKRWTRLVQGLRMRERLLAQYGKPKEEGSGNGAAIEPADADEHVPTTGGGFLTQPDDIVTAYKLPKNYYDVPEEGPPDTPLSIISRLRASAGPSTPVDEDGTRSTTLFMEEVEEGVRELEDVLPAAPVTAGPILSLAELAATNASRQPSALESADEDQDALKSAPSRNTKVGRPKARPVRSTRVAAVQPKTSSREKRGTASKKRSRGDDSLSENSDREAEKTTSRARPLKRMKTRAAPPPRSDRVLRTRSGKSVAQLEQEQDEALEDALDGPE